MSWGAQWGAKCGRLLALAGLAWGVASTAMADRSTLPEPLPDRPFVIPTPTQDKLSNGIPVWLVEDHERPLVWVSLMFRAGAFADPAGQEGLAEFSMDLLNDAAGAYDGPGLARAVERLGGSLTSGAGDDGSSVGLRALRWNLAPTLELMRAVVMEPRLTEADAQQQRRRMQADLEKGRADPTATAGRVLDRLLHGDAYSGRMITDGSIAAMTPEAARAWIKAHLAPDQAVLIVGGDTTMAEVKPLLEQAFGGWSGQGAALTYPQFPAPPAETAIHLVDKPGAAQSVIVAGRYVSRPTDPDHASFLVANSAIGGTFTSRINMNLRERNGYTYGARSAALYDLAGVSHTASAPVATDKTVPAMRELLAELRGVAGERALSEKEVADARDAIVSALPSRYENPDYLMGQIGLIWRYSLPADWVSGYPARLAAVTQQSAQAAWASRMQDQPTHIVVVGDAAVIAEGLSGLGLPLRRLDPDGRPLP